MSCASNGHKETVVLMETTMGDIKVKLYDDTPAHRDNFVKLVKEGYYDGTLFHRVINEFMIQGGDGTSRNAPAGKMLGMGDPGYTLPAEFVYPKYFHKRGGIGCGPTGRPGESRKGIVGLAVLYRYRQSVQPAATRPDGASDADATATVGIPGFGRQPSRGDYQNAQGSRHAGVAGFARYACSPDAGADQA